MARRAAPQPLLTPADEQDRAQVAALAQAPQDATGDAVALADVDQGYTGNVPAADAQAHGFAHAAVKLSEPSAASPGPPRFRRLARDYERLAATLATLATLAGLHFLAFACLMLHRFTLLTLSLYQALVS